jgi:hypothetical protein
MNRSHKKNKNVSLKVHKYEQELSTNILFHVSHASAQTNGPEKLGTI